MSLSKEQLDERKKGIGGSDSAAACGISAYKTRLQLFLEKTGKASNDLPENGPMKWGKILEPVIREEYSRIRQIDIIKPEESFVHPQYYFMRGNLDGIYYLNGKKFGIEIKTAANNFDNRFGEEGTQDIPVDYLMQVAHYCIVCDLDEIDIVVLIGLSDLRIFNYKRNSSLEKKIIFHEKEFWEKHVLLDISPEPSNAKDILALFPVSNCNQKVATEEVINYYSELKTIKENIKSLEVSKEQLEDKIKIFMEDSDTLIFCDKKIATFKNSSHCSFNLPLFKNKHKDIYDEFLEKKEIRRFLIK